MRKVFFTIGRLDRGGAETRLLELVEYFSVISSIDFYIFVVSGKKGEMDDLFLARGVKIIYAKGKKSSLLHLYRALVSVRPDVFHCNASLAGGWFCAIALFAGIKKRISHIRTAGDYGSGWLFSLKKILYSLALNIFSSRIIGVCDGAKKFSRAWDSKWITIYNGITAYDGELPTVRQSGKLICVGRMHPAKNQIFAMYVLNYLIEYFPAIDWTLEFYGLEDRAIKENILNFSQRNNLVDRVSFFGVTRNIRDRMKCCDVLLLPSRREGLPGVVLEAASVGVPAVCSVLPGSVEIAAALPSVSAVSLSDLPKWADEILRIRQYSSAEIVKNFKSSNFVFDVYIKDINRVWFD